MTKQEYNLILLLRSALDGRPAALSEPVFPELLELASKHGLSNMLYPALKLLPPSCQPEAGFMQQLRRLTYGAATREAIQEREFGELLAAFEAAKICVLPLKGIEIKHLYPSAGMRYMSDIDLLIPAEAADQAKLCLEKLEFRGDKVGVSDTDLYFSPLGMLYEVHKDLSGESFQEASRLFCAGLLKRSVPREGMKYARTLDAESHYAYVLCHFVKHLLNGGIGVRQVMDIYVCRRSWPLQENLLRELLQELGLWDFSLVVEALAENWFGSGTPTDVTRELGDYVLGSGVFGTDDQRVTDRMLKEEKPGRLRYALHRIFLPYRSMCGYYPVLRKLPFLLPVFWIWRGIYALLFRRNKLKNEIIIVGEGNETVRKRGEFYRRCGLPVGTDEKKG